MFRHLFFLQPSSFFRGRAGWHYTGFLAVVWGRGRRRRAVVLVQINDLFCSSAFEIFFCSVAWVAATGKGTVQNEPRTVHGHGTFAPAFQTTLGRVLGGFVLVLFNFRQNGMDGHMLLYLFAFVLRIVRKVDVEMIFV